MNKTTEIIILLGQALACGIIFTFTNPDAYPSKPIAIIVNSLFWLAIISAVGGLFHLFKKNFFKVTFAVGLILIVALGIGLYGTRL